MFKSTSFDPSTGIQSTKAKAFFDLGKWDTKDKIQIWLIIGSYCNENIGSTPISPSGIDRFCGKDSGVIASHCKAQVHILPYY